MIENCALFLMRWPDNLAALFPEGRLESDAHLRPEQLIVPLGSGDMVLNFRDELPESDFLRGFAGYVDQTDAPKASRFAVATFARDMRVVVGVVLPGPIAPESKTFGKLRALADAAGGFVFVGGGVLTPDGFALPPQDDPGLAQSVPLRLGHDVEEIRRTSLAALEDHGFTCSPFLPLWLLIEPRPVDEIVRRFCAMGLLYLHVCAPEDLAPEPLLREVVRRDGLEDAMTASEAAIYANPREAVQHERNQISWRLENMWPLAWSLGFDPVPEITDGQIDPQLIIELVEGLPTRDRTVQSIIEQVRLRPTFELIARMDLFYCAHNAVRSAQIGRETVPPGYDPLSDGGCIQERRHALGWLLSPGVGWDDVPLDT